MSFPCMIQKLLFASSLVVFATQQPAYPESGNALDLAFQMNPAAVAAAQQRSDIANRKQQSSMHLLLANRLAQSGDLQGAIREAVTALRWNSDAPEVWLTLGGLYRAAGMNDKALGAYNAYLSRFPANEGTPKIRSIVDLLEQELSAPRTGKPVKPASEDYYSEMTATGVVRWSARKMPIKVYIEPTPALFSGSQNSPVALLREAFDDWSRASQNALRFLYVDSPNAADIQCSWAPNTVLMCAPVACGQADTVVSEDTIIRGRVRIALPTNRGSYTTSQSKLKRVCLFAVGRVIGLYGVTTNPEDAMYASLPYKNPPMQLSVRDQRTIAKLYSNL